MSGSNNNFTPASRNWQTGYDYGAYVPSSNGWNNRRAMYPLFGSVSFPNANRGLHHPWQQLFGETMLEPPGVPEPYFPPLYRVTEDGMAREIYPTQRPIIQGSPPQFMNQLSSPPRSPPRFMNQQNIQVPSRDSRLTPDEQKTALKKLKKEIYNPTPKKLMRGLSLYYRDNAKKIYAEKLKENTMMVRTVPFAWKILSLERK
ncbi:hypothetical protein LWI29_027156 [Acer saccharum]|uniref:Uncharacterized protein n=1 Tax=Acer saccharum TaxID=4024 RepID=A0AA39VTR4_ACESA|nr:hypothetical protein LWI29_027156 [Acer saccharum]